MENKKDFEKTTLTEDVEKLKSESKWSETDGILALLLVAALFGDWGNKSKADELEKRISKLETKNEIIEKILF